jgi:exonuclease III
MDSFNSFLIRSGYVDIFRELHPETISHTSEIFDTVLKIKQGVRIDYFLGSDIKLLGCVIDCKVHNNFVGSDHFPISVVIDIGGL